MSGYSTEWSPKVSGAEGVPRQRIESPRHQGGPPQTSLLAELGSSYEEFRQGEKEVPEHVVKEGSDEKYLLVAGDVTFSLFSVFTQRVLVQPFLVYRNQCQLNTRLGTSYKLTPWSIIYPMINIQQNQGVMSFWKSLHNDFFISGTRKLLEMVVSENTSLPLSLDEPVKGNVVTSYSKHLLLKTVSCMLTTPLFCAGYTLRVQSQVVVNETNYLALFSLAYHRLISSFYSQNSDTSHLLPLYTLVVPITVLNLGTYIIHGMCNAALQRQYQSQVVELNDTEHDEVPLIKTMYDRYYPQLLSAFSGQMLSDIFFYPLSTITGRLVLQGTRTIIDDADTGNAVLPFTTTYTGVLDCLRTILREEGVLGLYKGFGALIMQYAVQALILRGTHLLYERLMDIHYPRVPRRSLYLSSNTPSSTYSSITSLNAKS